MKTFAIVLPLLQGNLQIAMSHFKCWIQKQESSAKRHQDSNHEKELEAPSAGHLEMECKEKFQKGCLLKGHQTSMQHSPSP